MTCRSTRRGLFAGIAALAIPTRAVFAQPAAPAFSAPIGLPGQTLGDGFLIRHGYACENTWFSPGWWHTGEDFYRTDVDTARAGVYAVADGEIVFAGSEYPGLVVIVQHAPDLFSMYGHLDHALAVDRGPVTRGQLLGTVLARTDGGAPSHLHFEMRTFLTTTEVNGEAPRYSVACGFNCAPGPGYWPIDAAEHPSALGWRNPTNVLAARAWNGTPDPRAEIVVARGAAASCALWSVPAELPGAEHIGDLTLTAGDRFRLLAVEAGPEASRETSAEGYRLWYQIEAPKAGPVWARAAVSSTNDTGADGRPSSVRLDFLPGVFGSVSQRVNG